MILILAEPLDAHANHVGQKLRERGADFVQFDCAQFPSQAELSLAFSEPGQIRYILSAREKPIDLHGLKAVWYRRPKHPAAHQEIKDEKSHHYVEEECKIVIYDAWNSLDCLWVPAHRAVLQRAQFRASQLKLAGALGFELPPTLFTNRPGDFLEFYRRHNGNIISKLAGTSFFDCLGQTFSRYTEVVSKKDVGYAEAVRYCPMIFQAYVPKRVELRITVIGFQVFAAEIHSQESNHTRHDWRRYDNFRTRYLPHELPRDVEQRCVRLVEQLGLCYGAIDMVVTPDGRYVFLEINPNGQYLWVEDATGLPISDALCDLLISGTPNNKTETQRFRPFTGDLP
jgi:glutathione synthase/RimK-type ligase-like ATP-grasp enzyme